MQENNLPPSLRGVNEIHAFFRISRGMRSERGRKMRKMCVRDIMEFFVVVTFNFENNADLYNYKVSR